MRVTIEMGIKAETLNKSYYANRNVKAIQAKRQKEAAYRHVLEHRHKIQPTTLITLTRIAPRPITDTDNLSGGMKHIRDGVAKCLRIDDGSPLVCWRYRQEQGTEYRVRVVIEDMAGASGGEV